MKEKLKTATASRARARADLELAFGRWDETVAEQHLAWIDVRKAERRLRAAEQDLQQVWDETGKENP